VLICLAPAQVILISTLGSAALIDTALAACPGGVRFMPWWRRRCQCLRDARTPICAKSSG